MAWQKESGYNLRSRIEVAMGPFTSGRQVPVFLIEACLKVTPPSCRTPVGPSAGTSQPLLAG